MNGDQYILSFDLSEINRQIAELQNSYSSLTESFKKGSQEAGDQLHTIEASVTEISSSLESSFQKMETFYASLLGNLESTTEYFEKLQASSNSVTQNLTKLQNVDLSRLKTDAPDDTAAERVAALGPDQSPRFSMTMSISAESDEIAEDALKKAEKAIQAAQKALKEAHESQGMIVDTYHKITKTIKTELKNAKGKMTGIARAGTKGVIGGGILASLIGMMIMGVQESQRKGAERGEMLNVFEAIGDMFEKNSKKAVGWFSRFAEKAQWYFGIGRKEIQGVVKQMVDAGYKSDEIMTDFSKNINDVEANVATLSIGIDKHLNQATGTSMQNMIKLVTQYGESVDSAADKYKRLSFEAQRSGMGVNKFIDSIMSGSSAMTQYGIEMEDVVEIMGKMQGYYEAMGLDKQFAGDQAAQAVKGIVGGIANLDEGVMAALAQRMFKAAGLNGLDAIQKFKEGAARVAAGEDKDFLIEAAKNLRQMAQEATGGDRATGIHFLSSMGMSNQQATALYDVGEKLEKGTKIEELSVKEQKALRESFKTEGKQLTELQKTQRSLIQGLSKMGEGLIAMVGNLIGVIAAGYKSILVALQAIKDPAGASQNLEKINVILDQQIAGMVGGFDQFVEGGKQTGSAIGGALGKTGENLKKILDIDTGGGGLGAITQRMDDISSSIGHIAYDTKEQGKWLEELQAQFDYLVNKVGEGVGAVDPAQTQAMQRASSERLDRMSGTQVKAVISHRDNHKAKSKIEDNVVQ